MTRGEFIAVIYFTGHYKCYLLGRKFLIRTDHSSLQWLLSFRDADGQLARWLARLSEYYYELEHHPSKQHQNADGMSRIPCGDHLKCVLCARPGCRRGVSR